MIDSIAMFIGYAVMLIIAVFILVSIFHFDYKDGEWYVGELLGFGYIVVPKSNEKLIKNIRTLRKSDTAGFNFTDDVLFFTAPLWFNRYIYNAGGTK